MREFIRKLEEEGELLHIGERLSPKFEIPAFLKYLTREKNVSLFFDDVEGYKTHVVGNLLGSKKKLGLALGVSEKEVEKKYQSSRSNCIKPIVIDDGPAKEVEILRDINIVENIPVLIHHKRDSGPYLTCGITIANDPQTGIRGMGIHRIQVKNKNTIGIFLATPPLSDFFSKAEEKGERLEIAIVVGIDPLTFLSSVIWAPSGVDKLDIAGGLAGRPVRLVKGSTVNLEVPADSEFVLEGYIIPRERQKEGPFGESTGYYFTYNNPVAKITAITHRKDAIYQALMPFTSEESVLLDFPWEIDNLRELQELYPYVEKVHLLNTGLMAIVQIKKRSDEESRTIMEKMLSNPFIKVVIVVDEDIDPYDQGDVHWAVSTRVQPNRDVLIKTGMDGLIIDPSATTLKVSKEYFSTLVSQTSKMGIDATKPVGEIDRYERMDIPEEVKAKVWSLIEKYRHG